MKNRYYTDRANRLTSKIKSLVCEYNKLIRDLSTELDRIDEAIEYIENCHGMYRNTIGDIQPMINIKPVLDILKGVDKE